MSLSAKTRIYIKLKSNPGLSIDDLYRELGGQVPKEEILDILDSESDYIELKKDQSGIERFYIKIILDKVRRRPASGFWEYGEIAGKRKPQMTLPVDEEFLPVRGDVIAERSQGKVGACFPGYMRVLMEDFSYKKISHVVVGDRVISAMGNICKVTEKYKRKWQGRTVKLYVYGLETPIECTLEHPILTTEGWVAACDINENDQYVAIPSLVNIVHDKTIYSAERDPDFLWVLGLYIAEGSTHGDTSIRFSLHRKEVDFYDKIKEVMSKYGASTSAHFRGGFGLEVTVCGRGIPELFEELGGKYCDKKEINKRLMFLEPELQMNIFKGWFDGDGCLRKERGIIDCTTTSPKLLRQFQIILLRNGMRGSCYKRWKYEDRKDCWSLALNQKETSKITGVNTVGYSTKTSGFFDENFYFSRVRKVEIVGAFLSENVYNLEVEEDNSYIVETVAVHNCVGAASSAMMDDIHMSLCEEDWPTEADKAEYKHDVDFYQDKPGVAYYDHMWFQSFSLAGIYWRSKQIFNVPGQGSYIDYALETIRREGAGRDRQWIHMKDGMHAFREPYPDKCPETGETYSETAVKHKIDGYARCSTASSMIQALKDHNGVGLLAAMEIAEGTFNSAYGSGIWQTWKGASMGGHAILIKGRKKRGSVWGWVFYNSWCDQGYPREEWMSDAYWNKAKIDCFVALDSEESSFARKEVYQHVSVKTNKSAKIYIEGKYWGDTVDNKIGAEVTIGKHKFKAESLETKQTKELEVDVTKETKEINLFFEDSEPDPVKPVDFAEIIKALKEFFKKLFGRS